MATDNTADVLNEIEKDGREEIVPAEETETAEPTEVGETDETAAADSNNETEREHQEKKRLGGWQRKLLKTESERDFWKEQALQRNREGKEASAEKPKADAPKKPTPDQYNTYEDYVDAFTDWKAEQKFQQLSAQQKEEAAKNEIEERAREVVESYNERLEEFREEHDDFNEKVGSIKLLQEVGMAVQNTLLEDEHGPALAYYLGQHPDLWQRMNEMTSTQAVKYLGRISERLYPDKADEDEEESASTPPPKAAAKRPSLPPPITPTRKSVPTDRGLSDNLDPAEWQRRFRKQMGYDK